MIAGTTDITRDKPIVINGALLSRGKIDLRRDLGALNNSHYPAEVVRFYPHTARLIKMYELSNREEFNYSGLEIFDVQFDYAK
jgi:hypothetical protein